MRWPGWITALVRKWKQCRAAKRHVNAKRLRFRDALFALVSPLFAFVKSWRGQSIKVFVGRSETLWIEENHASSFVFNANSTMNESQSVNLKIVDSFSSCLATNWQTKHWPIIPFFSPDHVCSADRKTSIKMRIRQRLTIWVNFRQVCTIYPSKSHQRTSLAPSSPPDSWSQNIEALDPLKTREIQKLHGHHHHRHHHHDHNRHHHRLERPRFICSLFSPRRKVQ